MSSNDVTVVLTHAAWADSSSRSRVIGATLSDAVRALVYLNALMPDGSETDLDIFTRTAPHAAQREQVILAAVQRPISICCITAAVARPARHDHPSSYLVADEHRMMSTENQRFTAGRICTTIATHSLDHCRCSPLPNVLRRRSSWPSRSESRGRSISNNLQYVDNQVTNRGELS